MKNIIKEMLSEEKVNSFKQIEDAKIVIKAIFNMDIDKEMKKKIIYVMIWNITGAFGKLNPRYISEGAINSPVELLRHEHVFSIKSLIIRIMDKKESLEDIFNDVKTCIVTKQEHLSLHPKGSNEEGWNRYNIAEIKVFKLNDAITFREISRLTNKEFMTLAIDERKDILKGYNIEPSSFPLQDDF